ncbi:MAG TPA: hypothetical protein VFN67_34440 [Polyangiales bacterium]|nr:hypothetical protein [Polyangiales bacterium]
MDTYDRDGGGGTGGGGGGGVGSVSGSGGMNGGAGAPDPLAPSLTFISPTPTSDPNSEDVLTGVSIKVRCNAEASSLSGAAPVDKSAVKIVLVNPLEKTGFTNGAVSAISDTEFEAQFDLTTRSNGSLTFQCSAKDLLSHMSVASMTTLVDRGPTLNLKKPQDKLTYALKTPMAIEFEVAPAPIAEGDEKANVKNVTLTVGGVETPVSESSSKPGLYQTSIDFSDKTKFPVQPASAQIQVSATNGRTPTAATTVAHADVILDGSGPAITVTSPGYASIQRGVVRLELNVTDPSGIQPGSLIATINTKPYSAWDGAPPKVSQSFDTNQIDPKHQLTQLTVNITAIDNVGNKTDPPVSHLFRLDNLPPVVSLDPPMIWESRTSQGTIYCSQLFDPVGDKAANDLEEIKSAQIFRALVEDRTNVAPGTEFAWHAGVNNNSVDMYTQPLIELPLLIDTNGDHICDAINKSDDVNIRDSDRVTSEQDPIKIRLEAVSPIGTAWFAKTIGAMCLNDPSGSDSPPNTVCTATEMWRVTSGRSQNKPPAVFAFTPSNNASVGACAGSDWNIEGNTRNREGWLCIAARAVDNIGNVGVSAPIRVCFDDSDPDNGIPVCDTAEAPTCTDGCSISNAQKFVQERWSL